MPIHAKYGHEVPIWGYCRPRWGFGLLCRALFLYLCSINLTIKTYCLMFRLFVEGGPISMAILTVLLVAIFFAAWKAPQWVKEIGSVACAYAFLQLFLGLCQMFGAIQEVSASYDTVTSVFDLITPGGFFGGCRIAMIPVAYGLIIFIISRVVHIVQKPRI